MAQTAAQGCVRPERPFVLAMGNAASSQELVLEEAPGTGGADSQLERLFDRLVGVIAAPLSGAPPARCPACLPSRVLVSVPPECPRPRPEPALPIPAATQSPGQAARAPGCPGSLSCHRRPARPAEE